MAAQARDSILKLIYEQLFQFLIDKSNETLISSSTTSNALIGSAHINILDILGFGSQHRYLYFKNNFSRY